MLRRISLMVSGEFEENLDYFTKEWGIDAGDVIRAAVKEMGKDYKLDKEEYVKRFIVKIESGSAGNKLGGKK